MTMSYIDGFIIPVPTGDDLPDGEVTERAVQVRDDETVVSAGSWPDRATRSGEAEDGSQPGDDEHADALRWQAASGRSGRLHAGRPSGG